MTIEMMQMDLQIKKKKRPRTHVKMVKRHKEILYTQVLNSKKLTKRELNIFRIMEI